MYLDTDSDDSTNDNDETTQQVICRVVIMNTRKNFCFLEYVMDARPDDTHEDDLEGERIFLPGNATQDGVLPEPGTFVMVTCEMGDRGWRVASVWIPELCEVVHRSIQKRFCLAINANELDEERRQHNNNRGGQRFDHRRTNAETIYIPTNECIGNWLPGVGDRIVCCPYVRGTDRRLRAFVMRDEAAVLFNLTQNPVAASTTTTATTTAAHSGFWQASATPLPKVDFAQHQRMGFPEDLLVSPLSGTSPGKSDETPTSGPCASCGCRPFVSAFSPPPRFGNSNTNNRASASPSTNSSNNTVGDNNELICPICMDIQRDAMLLVDCGHSFCQHCLLQGAAAVPAHPREMTNVMRECCVCRTAQSHLPVPDVRNRRKINSLKVSCGAHLHSPELRCDWQGRTDEYDEHMRQSHC